MISWLLSLSFIIISLRINKIGGKAVKKKWFLSHILLKSRVMIRKFYGYFCDYGFKASQGFRYLNKYCIKSDLFCRNPYFSILYSFRIRILWLSLWNLCDLFKR